MTLETRLKQRQAQLAVIGLGYVGLPLAVEFARAGFNVYRHRHRRDARRASCSAAAPTSRTCPTADVRDARQAPGRFARHHRLLARCAKCRHGQHLRADAAPQDSATPTSPTSSPRPTQVARYLHAGQLVILESTTYPGTTDELILPQLDATRAQGRQGLLPRLLARARRPGQPDVQHPQHPEGRRRRDAALHRRSAVALYRQRARDTSCRCPRRRSPRWSSCSRTRSAA